MNVGADKAANLAVAEQLIRRAVEVDRPDLVALPEIFVFRGEGKAKQAAAEAFPDGAAYQMLHGLARELRVIIHGGSLYERGPERLWNTTLTFDQQGELLARYRKIHLFDAVTPDGTKYHESETIASGNEIVTYQANGYTVGCAICYDLRFPEIFNRLAKLGAKIIILPAAFTLETGKDHWEVLLRARAIETQCFVLAPAQWGPDTVGSRRITYGHSLVVDPWGHVIARASDGVGFVTARLDFAVQDKARSMIPIQAHKAL